VKKVGRQEKSGAEKKGKKPNIGRSGQSKIDKSLWPTRGKKRPRPKRQKKKRNKAKKRPRPFTRKAVGAE